MRILFGAALTFVILLSGLATSAIAESYPLTSSTPLSFVRTYSVNPQPIRFAANVSGFPLSIPAFASLSANLSFAENMMVTTSATSKYATQGQTTSISLRTSNSESLLQLDASAIITLEVPSVPILNPRPYNISIPLQGSHYSVSVVDAMGRPHTVILGDSLIYVGGLLGQEFTVQLQPTLQWLPTLAARIVTQGPGVVSPSSIQRTNDIQNASVLFTANNPVTLFLINPSLTLSGLSAQFAFPISIGLVNLTPPVTPSVSLGNITIPFANTTLLSFEPNYASLVAQLSQYCPRNSFGSCFMISGIAVGLVVGGYEILSQSRRHSDSIQVKRS